MLPILPRPQVGAGRIRKEREIQVHTQKAVFVNSLVCVASEIFALHRTSFFRPQRISAVFLFLSIDYLHQMLFRPVTQHKNQLLTGGFRYVYYEEKHLAGRTGYGSKE